MQEVVAELERQWPRIAPLLPCKLVVHLPPPGGDGRVQVEISQAKLK